MKSTSAAGAASLAINPFEDGALPNIETDDSDSISSNISSGMVVPKLRISMPGSFPGVVAEVGHARVTEGRKVNAAAVQQMISSAMKQLTGKEGAYTGQMARDMINAGEKSYSTKVLTQEVDKVINFPVLKNWGPQVTLCLKGIAFWPTSNC